MPQANEVTRKVRELEQEGQRLAANIQRIDAILADPAAEQTITLDTSESGITVSGECATAAELASFLGPIRARCQARADEVSAKIATLAEVLDLT